MNSPAPRVIVNPHEAEVLGHDHERPALTPGQLSEAAIRAQLARLHGWRPAHEGDGPDPRAAGLAEGAEPKPAAVLMGLRPTPEGFVLLLTQRTAHLRAHAGQVSFPGGRQDDADHDAVGAALREAQEEVGLGPQQVQVWGTLPAYRTVTGYGVTPVVAGLASDFKAVPAPDEVQSVFEVPLSFLMNPGHHRRHRWALQGVERHFWSMPWTGQPTDGGGEREFFIWGATAAMLRNFYHLLSRP